MGFFSPTRWLLLYVWEDEDQDLAFAQDASLSAQFVQQWRLRMMAQEAALKEIANSGQRQLLAFNKSFTCTDVQSGDTLLFFKAWGKRKAPQRGGVRP